MSFANRILRDVESTLANIGMNIVLPQKAILLPTDCPGRYTVSHPLP